MFAADPIYEEEMPPVQQHSTTYEELRKQNREEYKKKRIGAYRLVRRNNIALVGLYTPKNTFTGNHLSNHCKALYKPRKVVLTKWHLQGRINTVMPLIKSTVC